MLAHTGFSLARASLLQDIAFVGFAIFTIGFFIWLVAGAQKVTARRPAARSGRLPGTSAMTYYALLFIAGLAGSFHCIGMCGGFACALGG